MVPLMQRRWFAIAESHIASTTSKSKPENLLQLVKRKFQREFAALEAHFKELKTKLSWTNNNELTRSELIVAEIEKAFCTPQSRLVRVGSLNNFLLFDNNSDINICFFPLIDAEERIAFRRTFKESFGFRDKLLWSVRDRIVHVLQKRGFKLIEKGCLAIHSTTPIVTIKFFDGLTTQIQFPFEDYQAIRNTNLIRHYILADARFSLVYWWLRAIFIRFGLKNGQSGLYSSYHVACWVIHFLQCKVAGLKLTVLPILCQTHKHLVGPNIPIDEVVEKVSNYQKLDSLEDWRSQNTMSPAELAISLVDYYSKIDALKYTIRIADGCLEERKKGLGDTSFKMFDPYSELNICTRELTGVVFNQSISFIHEEIQKGHMPGVFCWNDEVAEFRKTINLKNSRFPRAERSNFWNPTLDNL